MAQEKPPHDLMQYEALAQDALRGVVKAALLRAASPGGLPGDHHFYITFRTKAPGVMGPPDVLGKYPEEMTIIIQHQFWDLKPGETSFSVTLKFGGQPKQLLIPYAAVVRFFDPYVQFGLQFEPTDFEPEEPPLDDEDADDDACATEAADEPKVVSLDQFRKK